MLSKKISIETGSERDSQSIGDQIRPEKTKAKNKTEQADGTEIVQPSRMKELRNFDKVSCQQRDKEARFRGEAQDERIKKKDQHGPEKITGIGHIPVGQEMRNKAGRQAEGDD